MPILKKQFLELRTIQIKLNIQPLMNNLFCLLLATTSKKIELFGDSESAYEDLLEQFDSQSAIFNLPLALK
jgi:hypothetical protein